MRIPTLFSRIIWLISNHLGCAALVFFLLFFAAARRFRRLGRLPLFSRVSPFRGGTGFPSSGFCTGGTILSVAAVQPGYFVPWGAVWRYAPAANYSPVPHSASFPLTARDALTAQESGCDPISHPLTVESSLTATYALTGHSRPDWRVSGS